MVAHPTSTLPIPADRLDRKCNRFLKWGRTLADKGIHFTVCRLYPWCRDHYLSAAVLLLFPLAIMAYYWTRPTPESIPIPNYLNAARGSAARNRPVVQQKTSDIAPETTSANTPKPPVAPHPLPYGQIGVAGRLQDFPPLPIAVEAPKPISHANENPRLLWGEFQEAESTLTQCVWLTGAIEPLETGTESSQDASRVHELTMPSRN